MSLGCRISFSHRLVPKFENSVPRKRSYLTCQSAVGLFIKPRKKLKQPIACLLRSYHGGWYTKNGKLAMQYVYRVGLDLANKTIKVWYFGFHCRSPNKIQTPFVFIPQPWHLDGDGFHPKTQHKK